jgi:REP element-mobilizing transposase RayT
MPEYRRGVEPGGRFFFTLVTDHRRPIFMESIAREWLRQAIQTVQAERPFDVEAIALLPDADWLKRPANRLLPKVDRSWLKVDCFG